MGMRKDLHEACTLVLQELRERLPESSTKGFMPSPEVYKAMKELDKYLKEKSA